MVPVGMEALIGADSDRQKTEDRGLDEAFPKITRFDCSLDGGPIDSGIDSQKRGTGEASSPEADDHKEGGLEGVNYQGGDQSRGDKVAMALHPHGLKGHDLLAVTLDTQLGSQSRP